jgi:alkanesulfonate monooxygenase SsuD/methylene tetrahydromethanopterin reductase-like flavin-dependent oxidoreductase (luciferase family)
VSAANPPPGWALTGETPPGALVCVAVEGHLLQAGDGATLRQEAVRAAARGAAAVFVSEGPLGDPIVVAAGLGGSVPEVQLGVRVSFSRSGRHPAMLARDLTSLDLVCGGRSVVCFTPPFMGPLAEAIALCRSLWRAGEVVSDGPLFPVRAARNRARPPGGGVGSPLVALDLSDGDELPVSLDGMVDLVLRATGEPGIRAMEPV